MPLPLSRPSTVSSAVTYPPAVPPAVHVDTQLQNAENDPDADGRLYPSDRQANGGGKHSFYIITISTTVFNSPIVAGLPLSAGASGLTS